LSEVQIVISTQPSKGSQSFRSGAREWSGQWASFEHWASTSTTVSSPAAASESTASSASATTALTRMAEEEFGVRMSELVVRWALRLLALIEGIHQRHRGL